MAAHEEGDDEADARHNDHEAVKANFAAALDEKGWAQEAERLRRESGAPQFDGLMQFGDSDLLAEL